MPEQLSIPPSNLVLDANNPRLSEPNKKQRDALRLIAKQQGRKLAILAKDIVDHGLNPADLSIVMALKDDRSRYIVLEGNRRLAALKSLENPDSLVGAVDATTLEQIRKLSKQYQDDPIDSVSCVVVKDRPEAEALDTSAAHRGKPRRGIVEWNSEDKGRFGARAGKLPPHTQALDFLENEGYLTPEKRKKVPVTR